MIVLKIKISRVEFDFLNPANMDNMDIIVVVVKVN